MTTSSSTSLMDFEMDSGDIGEGVEVRVKASIIKSTNKKPIPSEDPNLHINALIPEVFKNSPVTPPTKPNLAVAPKCEIIKPRSNFDSLFNPKPLSKPHHFDANERFYKYKEKVTEKVQMLGKALEEEAAKECTFKPEIRNKSKNRTFAEFLNNVNKFDKKKQEKISSRQSEEEIKLAKISEVSKPKLCKKSLKMLKSKSARKVTKESTHRTLDNKSSSHTPAINSRSKDMHREKPINDILYEDALRRQNKTPTEPSPESKKPPKYTKSEKVLISKFKLSFQEQFKKLDIENSQTLNYSKFLLLLQNLGFISKAPSKINTHRQLCLEIWNLIGGFQENFVTFNNLQTVMLCIMNLKDSSFPKHQNLPSIGCLVHKVFCVNSEEILKIHKKFLPLYEEKNFVRAKSLDTGFQARKARKKTNTVHEEELIYSKTRMLEKQELLRQQKIAEEISECTFQPKIKRGPRTHASSSDLNDTSQSIYSIFSETKANIKKRGEILYEYSKLYNHQRTKIPSVAEVTPVKTKSCRIRKNVLGKKSDEGMQVNGVKELIKRLRSTRKGLEGKEKPFSFGMEQKADFARIDLNSESSSESSVVESGSMSPESKRVRVKVYLPDGRKAVFKYDCGDCKKGLIESFIKCYKIQGEFETTCRSKLNQILSNYT